MSKKEGLFDDSGDEDEMYKPQEEEKAPEVKPDPVGALAEVMDDDDDKKKEAPPVEDTAQVEEKKEEAEAEEEYVPQKEEEA